MVMFPAARLPDAVFRAVIDQFGFCDLIRLQRVNKSIRVLINKRGLFPRKINEVIINASTPLPGFVDTDDDRLWAHTWVYIALDFEGCEFRNGSLTDLIMLRPPGETTTRSFPCTIDNFLKLMSASHAKVHDFVGLAFDYRYEQVCESRPLPGDPLFDRMNLTFDISPFLRAFEAAATIYLELGKNISNFEIFRKILANSRNATGQLEIRPYMEADDLYNIRLCPRDDPLRCQRCVNRYGNAAPWNCVVCEETWAKWYEANNPSGQPSELGFPGIDDFSVSAVANLVDVALCPTKTHTRGQMLWISGKNDAEDFDLALFLREFERRLERVHDGRMELLEEAETDAETLKSWLLERLSVEQKEDAGISRRFYRMKAYGKDFVVAFLSSRHNFFARYAKFEEDDEGFKAEAPQANFLVAVFDM